MPCVRMRVCAVVEGDMQISVVNTCFKLVTAITFLIILSP